MKIENAQYISLPEQKNVAIKATIDGEEGWSFPCIKGNTEYDECMKQVKEGTLTIKTQTK